MIGPRYFLGFAIFSILMSATLIANAVSLLIAGHPDNQFVVMALPWCGLGILATWISAFVKAQTYRLAKLEARLKMHTKRQAQDSSYRLSSHRSMNGGKPQHSVIRSSTRR